MKRSPPNKGKGAGRRPLVAFRLGELEYARALKCRPAQPFSGRDPLKLSSWDCQQIFQAGCDLLENPLANWKPSMLQRPKERKQAPRKKPKVLRKARKKSG